jgi:hypothetical protein
MNDILYLFHHFHYEDGRDNLHHCGGEHCDIDRNLNYNIRHCPCGKHSIDKETAVGHSINENLATFEIKVKFLEICPLGGWHIESGVKL